MSLTFKIKKLVLIIPTIIATFSCVKQNPKVVLPDKIYGVLPNVLYKRETFDGSLTKNFKNEKLIFLRYLANYETYYQTPELQEKYPLDNTTIELSLFDVIFEYSDDQYIVPVYYLASDKNMVIVGNNKYFEQYICEENSITHL